MNIIKVNVGQDIDDVFKYKMIIEERLLKENKISEKLKLDDFIEYLDFAKTIYIEGTKTTVPFCIYKLDDDNMVIFHTSEEAQLNKLLDSLLIIMYNFSNLEKLTREDLMKRDVETNKFFIINEQFYGLPQ